MTEEIPQWAKERACELANAAWGRGNRFDTDSVDFWPSIRAFARYIAQHEQPPVDPDLVKAREICARVYENSGCGIAAGNCRSGKLDDYSEVQFALSALKEARNA